MFIACPLLLVPLPSTLPGLCQHISWLSHERWLLRPSLSSPACGWHLLPSGEGRASEELLRSWVPFAVARRVSLFAGIRAGCLWIRRRSVQPFSMSVLDQADNPRRLVTHDDDSVVSSCAYPYATVLGGMSWRVQGDRLLRPLHKIESQSHSWGVCITSASGGEELHLYSTQVIKDLSSLDPSSLAHVPFRGNGSQLRHVCSFPTFGLLTNGFSLLQTI